MQAQRSIEPTGRRGTMLATLWSAIGGDKYMTDASDPKER
jgi:hypothetical protein